MPLLLTEEIHQALNTLALPQWISKAELKTQYHFLAKKNHPDMGGNAVKMETLNNAYQLLMKYIEEFRYTFDDEEINKQFSGANHVQQFKP
ncbi:MAG: heat-shock protein [Epsilonproteobacteria bacterium]|nr:MAG: heat-shock protein [Campylobacterota bacterium]